MGAVPISVIIPLAPGEVEWEVLVSQLKLPECSEIILAVGAQNPNASDERLRVVNGAPGRAQQMNAGARAAVNEILWFLHADSRLGSDAHDRLQTCLNGNPEALYFFDLRFADDGPMAMKLNEWAVRIRAGWLKMPFGDQGFCIAKERFFDLGGYREDATYGEDHLLVWKARQEGVEVRRVKADIFTSARKYESDGWLRTTLKHVWLTVKQAAPQLFILVIRRIEGGAR